MRAVPKKDLAKVLGAGRKNKVGSNPFETDRKREDEEDTEYDFEDEFDDEQPAAKRARHQDGSANGGKNPLGKGKGPGGKRGKGGAVGGAVAGAPGAQQQAGTVPTVIASGGVSPQAPGVQQKRIGSVGAAAARGRLATGADHETGGDPMDLYTIGDCKKAIHFINEMGLQSQFGLWKTEKDKEAAQERVAQKGRAGGGPKGAGGPGGVQVAQSHEVTPADTKWEQAHHGTGGGSRMWGEGPPAGGI